MFTHGESGNTSNTDCFWIFPDTLTDEYKDYYFGGGMGATYVRLTEQAGAWTISFYNPSTDGIANYQGRSYHYLAIG